LATGKHTCPVCRININEKTLSALGIPPPDFRQVVIQQVEEFISRFPEYTEMWDTSNYSMVRRYKINSKAVVQILNIYIIVRRDIISFLDVRLFNRRGRQERDRLLEEIRVIEARIDRINNEIASVQTDTVTREMAVLLHESMLYVFDLNAWR